MAVTSKLMTLTLPEFSDLTRKEFTIVNEMVKPVAEQLYNSMDLTSSSQDSKRIDELDVETFAKLKREGENAQKARAGVGFLLAQLKSPLINGENLKTAIKRFKATLNKQITSVIVQLQRLSEETLFISEATVRSA